MSTRNRTIHWCEGKILEELGRRSTITTNLALSAIVLRNVRSIEEQHNLDVALTNLIAHKQVAVGKDADGFTVYRLSA